MTLGNITAVSLMTFWLASATASAQISTFQVTVPFPFVVGKQTLPAGTYFVQRLLGKPRAQDDTGVIVMKTGDSHIYKVIVTGFNQDHRAVRADRSELVFTSFQGKRYLNRVLVAGDGSAHQLANVPPEVAAQSATGEVIVTSPH